MRSNTEVIHISNTKFIPCVLEIAPGTSIKWVVNEEKELNEHSNFYNEVRAHVIEVPKIDYESTYLQANDSCMIEFKDEGVYDFSCGIVGTKGKVVVKRHEVREEPILHNIKQECKNILNYVENKTDQYLANAIGNSPEQIEDIEGKENNDSKPKKNKNNKKRNKKIRKQISNLIISLKNHSTATTQWVPQSTFNIHEIEQYLVQCWNR